MLDDILTPQQGRLDTDRAETVVLIVGMESFRTPNQMKVILRVSQGDRPPLFSTLSSACCVVQLSRRPPPRSKAPEYQRDDRSVFVPQRDRHQFRQSDIKLSRYFTEAGSLRHVRRQTSQISHLPW